MKGFINIGNHTINLEALAVLRFSKAPDVIEVVNKEGEVIDRILATEDQYKKAVREIKDLVRKERMKGNENIISMF